VQEQEEQRLLRTIFGPKGVKHGP